MKVVLSFLRRSNVLIIVVLFSTIVLAAGNLDFNKYDASKNGKGSNVLHPKGGGKSKAKVLKELSCPEDDPGDCEKDRVGIESIRMLHRMLDDDHNGNVDQSESDEFLRDELQYTDGFERQALFHNNDKLISVDDLWEAWKNSVVYNWTVDDVIEWLIQDVDLPQYTHVFYSNAIDGSFLPRLVNSTGPLLNSLGIRNPVHKQKVSLKAMDTVLFGAPKRVHSYVKDVLLVTSLIIAIGGCWFACLHHRYSQTQVKKMMKDLESLQKAEEALKQLSNELTEAEKNQKSVPPEKQEEMRMLRQSSIRLKLPRRTSHGGELSPVLSRDGSVVRRQEGEKRLKQAEEEIMSLRDALTEAETKLEIQQQLESQWCVPGELQAWLQLTHELEQLHYTAKHQAAERQLLVAKDGCDKIKKRNKAFLGSLRMAHSNSLDDIDQSLLNARGALEEVKQDLEERRHRWHTIELLCGFPVITNPGLSTLKMTLGRDPGGTGSSRGPGSLIAPLSIEEGDEDIPPAAFMNALQNGIHAPNRQNTLSSGYPILQASGPSKSFLKQTLAGSTNSLSHTGGSKGPTTTTGHGVIMRRESRENELHTSGHLAVTNPVSFNLGEGSNSHHERSHSNASSNTQRGAASTTLTNGHHPHQQYPPPHHYPAHSHSHAKLSNPVYSHANSYPPFHQKAITTSNVNGKSSLSTVSSHGTLSHKNGSSHASSYSNFRSIPSNSAVASANSVTGNRELSLEDNTSYRPQYLPLNSSGLMDDSSSNVIDSDYANSPDHGDMESNTRSTPRPPFDRSPEFDVSSLDTESLYSASTLEVKTHKMQKKPSKKKKFLSQFLRKSSTKQKTS